MRDFDNNQIQPNKQTERHNMLERMKGLAKNVQRCHVLKWNIGFHLPLYVYNDKKVMLCPKISFD